MVNRNAELQRLGHDPSQCETSLNHFVLEGFNSYGWTKRRTSWRHEQCGHFLEQDILLAKEWKRIAHQLRDSVRWASWKEFCESGRHEIADLELPYMTIDRINMTRKWAAASASRRSFAIRAVKSPKMAHLAHGCNTKCLKCGEINPDWDHGWTCLLQVPTPSDAMFRRFLWGTSRAEQNLADAFIEQLEANYQTI